MKYPEFQDSAKRHLESCHILLREADDMSVTGANTEELLLNIYYLSGYVLETTMKAALCAAINYPQSLDISQMHTTKGHLCSYNQDLKTHKLNEIELKLATHNTSIPSGIPIISDKSIRSDFMKMYMSWNSEIRYSKSYIKPPLTTPFDLNLMKDYIDVVKTIMIELNKLT